MLVWKVDIGGGADGDTGDISSLIFLMMDECHSNKKLEANFNNNLKQIYKCKHFPKVSVVSIWISSIKFESI